MLPSNKARELLKGSVKSDIKREKERLASQVGGGEGLFHGIREGSKN